MHTLQVSLVTCGKYLSISGKVGTISGLNIVNFTKFGTAFNCNRDNQRVSKVH